MYKDCITNIKVPGLYILMNSKSEFIYNLVFESVFNIITQYNKFNLDIQTIVTDSELALINVTNKYFPKNKEFHVFFIIIKICFVICDLMDYIEMKINL